jgi:hypothetical protein
MTKLWRAFIFRAAIKFGAHICYRNSGSEMVLDIEYTVGLAGSVPITFISVGEDNNDSVMGALVRTCNSPAGMFHSTYKYGCRILLHPSSGKQMKRAPQY